MIIIRLAILPSVPNLEVSTVQFTGKVTANFWLMEWERLVY